MNLIITHDLNFTKLNENDIEDILKLETELANISVPTEDQRNETLQYNLWSIKQLLEEVSFVRL